MVGRVEILQGKPTDPATWAKLDELLRRIYPMESGGELRIERMFVDSGDGMTTSDVYAWVKSTMPDGQVMAI